MESKGKSRGINLVTSFLSLFVFVAMDYFSIGCKLFTCDGMGDAPSTIFFSSSVFLLTTYFSQMTYALTSNIGTGIAASIVFEAALISRQIALSCYRVLTADGAIIVPADFYANIFLCMAISTALFAVLSFVPYIYKAGDHLKDLPLLAVFSLMASIGISIFRDATGEYIGRIADPSSQVLLGLSIAGGLLVFLSEQVFPDFAFLVPLSAFIIIVLFNVLYRVVLGQSVEELRNALFIQDFGKDAPLRLWDFLSIFNGFTIHWGCVLSNAGNILSLVLFNLIHINTNVISYSFVTKNNIDFNAEWKTQGLSNLFTTFTGFPSYFVSSTSILFFKAGAKTRTASMLGSMAPAILAIISPYIRDYIPNILSGIILSYLGMSFVYSYCIRIRPLVSATDFAVVCLGIVFCQAIGFTAGFAIVAAIASITALRYYQRVVCAGQAPAPPSSGGVVRVDYILCFMTLNRLKQDLSHCNSEVTLDLSACPYVDMNANFFITDYAKGIAHMHVLGHPENLYVDMLRAQPNIHLSEVCYHP